MANTYFGPGYSDPNDQSFPDPQDDYFGNQPSFTDETTVVGNPNLSSRNPFENVGSYHDPASDTFPNPQDMGGDGVPQWLKDLVKGQTPSGTNGSNRGSTGTGTNLLASLLPLLMRLLGGGGSTKPTPEDAQRQAQLNQLNQLMIDKAQRQAPVHQAAMTRALQLTPSGAPNPRMTEAIQTAQTPRQTAQTDPQVLSAIQRLMKGAG